MESTPYFQKELINIRVNVLRLIYEFIAITSAIALGIIIYGLITTQSDLSSIYSIISVTTVIITLISTTYIRFKLNGNNYKVYLYILAFLFSYVIFLSGISSGPTSIVLNLLVITAVLTITIVINARIGFIYFIGVILFLISLVLLHQFHLIEYVPSKHDNEVTDVIILLALLSINFRIARIAYQQIQTYLNKVIEYSKHLEQFNSELTKRVKLRTNVLQKNFNKRIESMYTTSMIGSIAKPLIHDILSPFSALEGTLQLIEDDKKYNPQLVEQAIDSASQISNIIHESRELIRGRDITTEFDIVYHIDRVVKILKHELDETHTCITFTHKNSYPIKGVVSLFERIIINIVVNAIEELKNKDKDRKIGISINSNNRNVFVEITDNGRGIPPEFINKIFEEEFSLKHNDYNLGLGLPFIKDTMDEKFNGKVDIQSQVGSFTTFILRFNLCEAVEPQALS